MVSRIKIKLTRCPLKGWLLMSGLLVERWLTGAVGGRRVYEKHLRKLVAKTGLFDAAYYSEANQDALDGQVSPLHHYVARGDKKGRWPMPLFDPLYYRAQANSRLARVNALLHYAFIGRYLQISPSPWFDVGYYLKENKDVARSGIDPVLHYLKWGGVEGRSPSLQFDGSYYLRNNPDVLADLTNPLLHYLRIGRFEERPIRCYGVSGNIAGNALGKRIDNLGWPHHPKRSDVHYAKLDVVVPVYKNALLTLRAIHSVLTATVDLDYELVVIDDCSHEAALVNKLKSLAAEGLFTLLRNERNLGFVGTANRGMRLHPDRDIVLLNADAEVFNGWLDRLYAAAYRHPRTGTVTPLSNNATIASYPCFLSDNPYPLELRYEDLDTLAATSNRAIEVEAPTCVGFCTYIRRDCLNDVGLFDEVHFGRGYGEENDFSQRAITKGWRNIIVADTFVRHWGSASFQAEKAHRVSAALKVINTLHPDYKSQVDAFIHNDPLAECRARLDWARLRRQVKAENVLVICHARGGGAERHVQEDTLRLMQQGIGVFYLRPVPQQPTRVRLGHPKCQQLVNISTFCLADIDELSQVLADLHITRIHTHGLVDFSSEAPQHILAVAQRLGVEFWVDLHDYKVVCPRINLTYRSGRYCGEPDEAACARCCETEGNDFNVTDIVAWRALHQAVLKEAHKILVPSVDMADRLARYFPDLRLSISPHEDLDFSVIAARGPRLDAGRRLRIVVIGMISRAKGVDIFNACAEDAQKRALPLEFILLGHSLKDAELTKNGVKITGKYLEHEAQAKLQALEPHVVWLPSVWPETYSYTLSLALLGGYPVFAFDIGAIAARLRESGQENTLMPLAMADDPLAVNQRFLAYLDTCRSSE